MSNCLLEFQKAVYDQLMNNSVLMALVTDVYSHVPQETRYPYLVMNKGQSDDFRTRTTSGIRVQLTIKLYSRYHGAKESFDILSEVKRVLNNASLSMTGCSLVSLRFDSNSLQQANDGVLWQGESVFNAVIVED